MYFDISGDVQWDIPNAVGGDVRDNARIRARIRSGI
jgi:hypothetical protein